MSPDNTENDLTKNVVNIPLNKVKTSKKSSRTSANKMSKEAHKVSTQQQTNEKKVNESKSKHQQTLKKQGTYSHPPNLYTNTDAPSEMHGQTHKNYNTAGNTDLSEFEKLYLLRQEKTLILKRVIFNLMIFRTTH